MQGQRAAATGSGSNERLLIWAAVIAAVLLLLASSEALAYAALDPGINLLGFRGQAEEPTTKSTGVENTTATEEAAEETTPSSGGSTSSSTSEEKTQQSSSSSGSSSSGSYTKTPTGSQQEEAAVEKAIRDHYTAIGANDFDRAYSYFGPTFRSTNDKEGWIANEKTNRIAGSTIHSVKVNEVSGSTAIATVDVSFKDKSGTPRFLLTWNLVKEGGYWKLDSQVS